MTKTTKAGLGLSVLIVAGALALSACMSDRSTNTPLEDERYSAVQASLDSACAQFCLAFGDALEARFETDTALIPGLEWPFEMPPRQRTLLQNAVDDSTSWGAGYDVRVDTTRYRAFWGLGRFVDTGVIEHTSPIVATAIRNRLIYSRVDGSGDDKTEWSGTLTAWLKELDTDTADLSATFTAAHKVGEHCDKRDCDEFEIEITDGHFNKIGDDLALSTLSANLTGTFKLTEFSAILGYDAVYIWELSGTITDGVASITASSGKFTETGTYSLCP